MGDAASDCGESAAAAVAACLRLMRRMMMCFDKAAIKVSRHLPGIEFSDRSPWCRSLHTQDAQMALLLVRDTTIVGESPSYRTAS